MELRPYQSNALAEARRLYSEGHRSILICCPTGGGKTVIASSAAKSAVEKGHRVLWVAHRSELVAQAASTLRRVIGKPVGVFQGNRRPDSNARIQVATIQTLIRRESIPEADLVIGDEAHRMLASQWHGLLETYDRAKHLYLTATPERGDGKPLGDLATALIPTVQPAELISEGVLVPCAIIAPNFKIEGAISDCPVEAYLRWADRRRAVFFCQTKIHARAVSEKLTANGIPNGVVTDDTPWATRQIIYRKVADGTLRALVNVAVATEGLDIPPLEVCVIARSVGHSAMYLQMVGRCLRSCEGKSSALIIDLKGVVKEFGSPEANREYHLEGDEAVTIQDEGMADKTCKDCGSIRTSPVCPVCGLAATSERSPIPDIVSHTMEFVQRIDHSDDAARDYIRIIHKMKNGGVRGYARAASEEFRRVRGCYPAPAWVKAFAEFISKKLDTPPWWPEEIVCTWKKQPAAAE